MPEYSNSIVINVDPQETFRYVTNFDNMPSYLPTVKRAQDQGEGRILVEGEVRGRQYQSDGQFNVDQEAQKMEWSADGDRNYHGWLQVGAAGDNQSRIEVHVFLDHNDSVQGQIAADGRDPDEEINRGLLSALQSIQNQLEGGGGKVDSANDTGDTSVTSGAGSTNDPSI